VARRATPDHASLPQRTPNSSAGLASIEGSPLWSQVSFHAVPPVKSDGRIGRLVVGRKQYAA